MTLDKKCIAFLLESDFHEIEFFVPYYRLLEEGVEVKVIGINGNSQYKGKLAQYPVTVNVDIEQADPAQFDGVIIPGGYSPEYLRTNEKVLTFLRALHSSEKMVAAICHGVWLLASAEIVTKREVTCHPYIKHDVIHAGGVYVDQPVTVDQTIITSRLPHDLPAFCSAIMNQLRG